MHPRDTDKEKRSEEDIDNKKMKNLYNAFFMQQIRLQITKLTKLGYRFTLRTRFL